MEVIRKIVNQISPYMKSYGYKFSQKCFYRIQNDIAYCVQFDVPSGFVYASFFYNAIVYALQKPILYVRQ